MSYLKLTINNPKNLKKKFLSNAESSVKVSKINTDLVYCGEVHRIAKKKKQQLEMLSFH